MTRLSSSIEGIKEHYQVVVIGSGYGGGIAASRLARAGQQVCILERGKEFRPGEYPDTEFEGAREMQFDLPGRHLGPRTGLYDFRVNENINVVLGCGLGGTSLINANVSLPADDRVFDDARWPVELRGHPSVLAPYYERATEMLKPSPYPEDFPKLAKLEALKDSAVVMNQEKNFYRPPINVNFEKFADGVNHVGVFQQPCKLCGDCVSGCNHAAKNTTLMNYLPDAHNHGAEIFTQTSVCSIERKDERWLVHYQVLNAEHDTVDARIMVVSADIVILSAGTLGSTEILLRSQAKGLPLSLALGQGFTGNGDVMAFGYNGDQAINGIGYGRLPPEVMMERYGPVGPCIAGIIDLRDQPNLEDGMVVEEGSIPGVLSLSLPCVFAAAAAAIGKNTGNGLASFVDGCKRKMGGLLGGPHYGAVQNTQTYLAMSHDDSKGRMYLDSATDRLRIGWKGVGGQPGFSHVSDVLQHATKAHGGTFINNPIWTKLFKHHVVTVHPLGGCAMADDAEHGVVNHKGQVFAGSYGTAVHEGLYVCDGAVIPRSLGVNPLLTISALAERSMDLLAKDRGWNIDYALPSAPRAS
jgi:cholesterol oxidase